jgi:hypothetical protein
MKCRVSKCHNPDLMAFDVDVRLLQGPTIRITKDNEPISARKVLADVAMPSIREGILNFFEAVTELDGMEHAITCYRYGFMLEKGSVIVWKPRLPSILGYMREFLAVDRVLEQLAEVPSDPDDLLTETIEVPGIPVMRIPIVGGGR